jgi:hypothetical protein
MVVHSKSGQKVQETPSQPIKKKAAHGGMYLSFQRDGKHIRRSRSRLAKEKHITYFSNM